MQHAHFVEGLADLGLGVIYIVVYLIGERLLGSCPGRRKIVGSIFCLGFIFTLQFIGAMFFDQWLSRKFGTKFEPGMWIWFYAQFFGVMFFLLGVNERMGLRQRRAGQKILEAGRRLRAIVFRI